MKKTKLLAFGLGLLAAAGTSFGQLPVSETVGIFPTEIVTGFNVVALPFDESPTLTGTVASASGISVTLDQDASAAGVGANFSIRFTSGANAGLTREIASAAGTVLTLTNPVSSWVSSDDGYATYEIVAHPTLDSAFPGGGGLVTNATSGLADQIFVPDSTGFNFDQYFHNGTIWQDAVTPAGDAGSTAIGKPGSAVMIFKPFGAPLTIGISGVAQSVSAGVEINGTSGFFPVANAFGSGTTLDDSGLDAILLANATSGLADQVWIPNAFFNFDQYFYNGTIWQDAVTPAGDVGSTPIPAGSGILVFKTISPTVQDWTIQEVFATGP
ncbi:MAG: hypothetical protein AAGA58_14795 [Verrucomicrobiota bacterium]